MESPNLNSKSVQRRLAEMQASQQASCCPLHAVVESSTDARRDVNALGVESAPDPIAVLETMIAEYEDEHGKDGWDAGEVLFALREAIQRIQAK